MLGELDERIDLSELRLNERLAVGAGAIGRFGGHVGSEVVLEQPATGLLQRVEKGFLVREMAEQRGEIGEGLMKGGDVDIGRLGEEAADAVDHGMRGPVRDDVV